MRFDNYKEQIEHLVPAVNSPDFESLLDKELADATMMDKIAISIEVKRLHIPCYRKIDLRDRIKTRCKEYTLIDGQKHWLDEIGYQIYLSEIPRYNNILTEGIWEKIYDVRNRLHILDDLKKNAQQDKQENDIFTGNGVEFGYYLHRKEARLNLSLSLNIVLTPEDKQPGTCVNLSKSGLRLITNTHSDFELGKVIQIKYTGLIRYYPDLKTNLDYQIVKVVKQPDNQVILQLKAMDTTDLYGIIFDRIEKDPAITTSVDKRDLYLRTRNYLYEYYYLNHTPTLPLLFKGNIPYYAILSPANQAIWRYWHNENNLQEISPLVNTKRLKKLTESPSQSLIVYCFKHVFKGKVFFFSATLDEMLPEVRDIFWNFGAEKKSWRVFKLTLSDISKTDVERLATTMDTSLIDPTGLNHLCQIQDVTSYKLISDFYSAETPQAPGSLLNSYCHQRNSNNGITPISIAPQRHEERYNYELSVDIDYKNQCYSGKTIDFSPRGLNVRLDTFLNIPKDTRVNVNFPDLEKASKQISLKNIPYRVIRSAVKESNITLTLAEKNQGMLFFQKLIDVNKSKLPVNKESYIDQNAFETIHSLLLSRLNSIPLFIFNQEQKVSIKYVGINYPLSPLAKLFRKEDGTFGFKDILEAYFQSLIYLPLTQEKKTETAHTLYLGIENTEDKSEIVHCQFVDDMKSQEDREQAIQDIQKKYEFKAVKFICRKTQKPSHLIKEIFAQIIKEDEEKATELNQELHTLVGYAELIDTTDEILARATNSRLVK